MCHRGEARTGLPGRASGTSSPPRTTKVPRTITWAMSDEGAWGRRRSLGRSHAPPDRPRVCSRRALRHRRRRRRDRSRPTRGSASPVLRSQPVAIRCRPTRRRSPQHPRRAARPRPRACVRDDGIVEIDPATCTGCGACIPACPYDALSYAAAEPMPLSVPVSPTPECSSNTYSAHPMCSVNFR